MGPAAAGASIVISGADCPTVTVWDNSPLSILMEPLRSSVAGSTVTDIVPLPVPSAGVILIQSASGVAVQAAVLVTSIVCGSASSASKARLWGATVSLSSGGGGVTVPGSSSPPLQAERLTAARLMSVIAKNVVSFLISVVSLI